MFQELKRLIRFDPMSRLGWRRAGGCPETYLSYRFLRQLCERKRFDWLAGGLQKFTEFMLAEWVKRQTAEIENARNSGRLR